MNQVLIVIVLAWLRQSPPEPTAQTGDSCAECHAAYQVDTTPGTHTVSAGCLSCHAPHEIKEGKLLPTKPPTDEQCLECHSEAIEAAAHPLRARLSEPQLKEAGTSKEADLRCMSCHKLHHAKSAEDLLRLSLQESELCLSCHPSMRTLLGGVHDLRKTASDKKNQSGQTVNTSGPCSACHMVHSSAIIVAKTEMEKFPIETHRCVGCHSPQGGLRKVPFRRHPELSMDGFQKPGDLGLMPLVDGAGKPDAHRVIGCLTCHNPHGRATGGGFTVRDPTTIPESLILASRPMLRPYVAPNLCSSCHAAEGLQRFLYFHAGQETPTPSMLSHEH